MPASLLKNLQRDPARTYPALPPPTSLCPQLHSCLHQNCRTMLPSFTMKLWFSAQISTRSRDISPRLQFGFQCACICS
ncbi:hypothetical protein XENTR_v10005632 [Xenopus tropicalis]|nr:hypothetical protein XENTR_v10005632 [Xenopus tropicalis]